MTAKPIALYKDETGRNWPIPTANIATYKRNLRSSRGKLLAHLSEPLILKNSGDDKIIEKKRSF